MTVRKEQEREREKETEKVLRYGIVFVFPKKMLGSMYNVQIS